MRTPAKLVHRISAVLLLALPVAAPADAACTKAPPRPAGAAVSDQAWKQAVHPNCFDNRLRLSRWTGRTTTLAHKQSPAKYHVPVDRNEITGGSVVVLVHGWAPGFRTAVDRFGGDLQWWSKGAVDSDGDWTSDWAWVATSGTDRNHTEVTSVGVFPELFAYDPVSTVLGYSWLDDSATQFGSVLQLDLVYRSEAYTNVNGLRLAAALEEVLAPSFWSGQGNRLHLIGHSHGSKVATVAALALQSRGRPVDHLTVLDSPDRYVAASFNGANLLGWYIDQLTTRSGTDLGGTSTFVDNYVSYFGAAFGGSPNASRVVNVVLDPRVFSCHNVDADKRHAYAANWYAGAALAASVSKLPPVGLRWPPPQTPDPALNQQWPGGNQWLLTAGQPGSLGCDYTASFCAYDDPGTQVQTKKTTGNVSGSPASGLVFAADAGSGVVASSFSGSTTPSSRQYGIAFQVEWTAPAAGDYLVFTGDTELGEEVLLVMDGRSAIPGVNPVSINADVEFFLDFEIYYLPAATNRTGKVRISDFRRVEVRGSSCETPLASDAPAADDAPAAPTP
jgi:hypothetical protein